TFGNDIRVSRQASLTDVQKGNNLRMALGDDMPWEAREGGASGTASIHQRGHAGIDAPQVRMHTVAVKTLEHVGVQVNQARRDDLAGHFMHASGLFTGNSRRNLRNVAILDGNIVDAMQAGRRVYNGTTLE